MQSKRRMKTSSCMKDWETGQIHQLTRSILSSTRDKQDSNIGKEGPRTTTRIHADWQYLENQTRYPDFLSIMPLKVIVVGAGIGGLCAALSLRQAGHHVEVNSSRELFLAYQY